MDSELPGVKRAAFHMKYEWQAITKEMPERIWQVSLAGDARKIMAGEYER